MGERGLREVRTRGVMAWIFLVEKSKGMSSKRNMRGKDMY
jgi:hypothetical protein